MTKSLLLTLAFTASIIPASQAAITLTVSAGELLTSTGAIVPDRFLVNGVSPRSLTKRLTCDGVKHMFRPWRGRCVSNILGRFIT
jgi:hypothetical protein